MKYKTNTNTLYAAAMLIGAFCFLAVCLLYTSDAADEEDSLQLV